ncbi:MAG: VanZ family protein [Clostridiales bacterium]|nr:VanZ family protein [Clostridiales bacterium]
MANTKQSTLSRVLLILFRVLFTFFAVYTTWFIFSNSLEIGSVSSARSGEVTAMLNQILSGIGLPALTEAAVRKWAHFGEFMVLGFWFMLCLRVYTRHYIRHISWPLLLGLLIANTDEFIQLYVSGRSSSVTDVWIDFGGVCVGVGVAMLALVLCGGFLYLLGFGGHRQPE